MLLVPCFWFVNGQPLTSIILTDWLRQLMTSARIPGNFSTHNIKVATLYQVTADLEIIFLDGCVSFWVHIILARIRITINLPSRFSFKSSAYCLRQ